MTGHVRLRLRRLLCLVVLVVAAGAVRTVPASATPSPPPDRPLVYVVQDRFQGQPEFLFEIADRFLGNGDRFRDIFDINRGRRQADGSVLVDPRVLAPGTALEMPPDARGLGLQVPAGGVALPAERSGSRSSRLPLLAAAGAPAGALLLLGSGVLLWRRPGGRTRTGDQLTGLSADWTVDRAMRALAAECERTEAALPVPYLISVDAKNVVLRLASPRTKAPSPWSVADDGRRWLAALSDLQTMPVTEGAAAPFPMIVRIGSKDDALLLLDLAQAQGVISIEGDPAVRRSLLDQWIRQLQSNPWSRPGLPILGVGFGNEPPAGSESVDTVLAATQELAAQETGVLFVAASPSRRERELLGQLARLPGAARGLVVGGAFPHARWTFSISRLGLLHTDILPGAVETGLGAR